MMRQLLRPALCGAALLTWTACRDEAIPLPQDAARIASLSITGDVLLADLGVEERRVAGVSRFVDDPGIHERPGVFPHAVRVKGDFESVLALRPDLLIVASFQDPAFLEAVDRAGLASVRLPRPTELDSLRAALHLAGRALGRSDQADSLVRWMDSVLQAVKGRAAVRGCRPEAVFVSGNWTAGTGSTIHELLEAAGAHNLAAHQGKVGSDAVDTETLLRWDPDVVVTGDWAMGGGRPEKSLPAPLRQGLRAARANRVVQLPSRWLLSTSHRAVLAADSLERALTAICAKDGIAMRDRSP